MLKAIFVQTFKKQVFLNLSLSCILFLHGFKGLAQNAVVLDKNMANAVRSQEYSIPLFFDPEKNGLRYDSFVFEYDLSEKKSLKLGPVELSNQTFQFALMTLEQTHVQMKGVLGAQEARQYVLFMQWPYDLIQPQSLEVINRSGDVLYQRRITSRALQDWKEQLDDWAKKLRQKGVHNHNLQSSLLFRSAFGLSDLDLEKTEFFKEKSPLRFCLSSTAASQFVRLCTSYYLLRMQQGPSNIKNRLKNHNLDDFYQARILIGKQEADLKQSFDLKNLKQLSFFAQLSTGLTYEFLTSVQSPRLIDVAQNDLQKDLVRIVGYEPLPLGSPRYLTPDTTPRWIRFIGFEETIGEARRFWLLDIPQENSFFYVKGAQGGVFRQNLTLTKPPPHPSLRVFLHRKTPQGTYIDGSPLRGKTVQPVDVSSQENSILSGPDHQFIWKFKAQDKHRTNRSSLLVKGSDGAAYPLFYELYRGVHRELSLRGTGILSSSGSIFMGEVAYNHWFENIAGWTHPLWSVQRWGLSAKYFNSINKFKVDSVGNQGHLTVWNADLKYRTEAGLWSRDATLGLILSYQDIKYNAIPASMYGFGGFWARSMPRIFDEWMNQFAFLRYPKWVDMEFVYYSTSGNSNIVLNPTYALNFHGKINWTPQFFGEAGFGLKTYSFGDTDTNQKITLNTLYTTFGLGLNF